MGTGELSSAERAYEKYYIQREPIITADLSISDPFAGKESHHRPNAGSVDDGWFGDGGKGNGADKVNLHLLSQFPNAKLYSRRWNGSSNTGHEISVHGKDISFHLLPVATARERTVSMIGRGVLAHPIDLANEIKYVGDTLGGKLSGELFIDSHVLVSHDVHRAYEKNVGKEFGFWKGSTGTGVAPGYGAFYERRPIRIEDFAANDWEEKFKRDYRLYARFVGGEDILASTEVNGIGPDGKRSTHQVGNLSDFLGRLADVRSKILPYITDTYQMMSEVWKDPSIPLTFEAAQGDGLDPFFGIYPDVTSSRPLARVGIPDDSEGLVAWDDIPFRGVIRKLYQSSVGSRVLPYSLDPALEQRIREDNRETGRTTGRNRNILPQDDVIGAQNIRIAGNTHVILTHADSAYPEVPVQVVTRYTDKESKKDPNAPSRPFRPYQTEINKLGGVIVDCDSWDGKKAGHAKIVQDFQGDLEPLARHILYIREALGIPVGVVTNGKSEDNVVFMHQ